ARLALLDESHGHFPVGGRQRLEAVALEVAHDDVPDDRLVIDDENGLHRRILASRACDVAAPSRPGRPPASTSGGGASPTRRGRRRASSLEARGASPGG